MKGFRLFRFSHSSFKSILGLVIALNSAAGVCAQEVVVQATDAAAPASPAPAPEADATQRRIARARALAAAGKRGVAAGELEALYTSTKDESVRDVSRILLMWIYVDMPDYTRAAVLLDEAFKARAGAGEDASRDYYTLAGQVLGGARAHVERYRTFGLRPDDGALPEEAKTDLDQMRALLERVLEQARQIREEEARTNTGTRGADATALVEEAANVRLRLARNEEERTRWQREVADARQRLFAPETQIAKIGDKRPAANAASVRTQSAPPSAAPPPQTANAETQTPASAPAADESATRAASEPAVGEAAKSEGGPVAVGALHGIATHKIAPSYPQLARTARVSGLVTVYVVVNEKGEVERVQRADGPAQLQSAASEAARRWKFRPTVVGGHPVRVSGYINFNFSL